MKDKYFTTAMRAVNLLFMSLLKNEKSETVLIVMATHQSAERCFAKILEILRPCAEYLPLIVSKPTCTLRFGGKVVKVASVSNLYDTARGIELQDYWLDEAAELTPEQFGLLQSRVRK